MARIGASLSSPCTRRCRLTCTGSCSGRIDETVRYVFFFLIFYFLLFFFAFLPVWLFFFTFLFSSLCLLYSYLLWTTLILQEPLLYSDLYEYTKLGTFDHRTDWDNGDWGGWQEPPESPGHTSFEACGTACHDHPDCKAYTYDTSGHCIFVRTMRLGSSKKLLGTTARLLAGWDVEKMKHLQEELNADCKRPRWVKPSITRIF